MDPITGIGLAASVIQLLTFSVQAVTTCREVYEQGSVKEYRDLDYTTGHLASLTRSLQQSLQSSSTRSWAFSREEKDLLDLGQKCEDCAKELQRELSKLKTRKRGSTLEAARLATRAIWKKSTINKIRKDLEKYQSTLEISLLSRLSLKFNARGLQNGESFADLDRSLQHIITCLANSQTRLSELMKQESEDTRRHITAQVDRVERLRMDNRRYDEIINSLFYPDISSRQEQVGDQFGGIDNSYDWIFDDPRTLGLDSSDGHPPQKQSPRWNDFASWLRSGHEVYWINGKAGSGKSTLMNHICTHSRTLELLREWGANRRLLTPTFFFWNAGSRLQKSIDGLLRSLVYQMLKECPELIGCFTNEPLHTWTQSRLVTTLLDLLRQSQVPIAICMFIDGLDEFEGREDTVIKIITDLADQNHVKVCLSSRPLPMFEEAFNGRPSLRLQDLTFHTIREYAKKQLSPQIQKRALLNKNDGDLAEKLLTSIVERADGVFLWAIIAIRDVGDGLRGFVDMNQLTQTVKNLPSELESLYMRMLHRIKSPFKRDAAYFLGVALYQDDPAYDGMDLCRLQFCRSQRDRKDAAFSCEEIATKELVVECHILETCLRSHTVGLLELSFNINNHNPCRFHNKRADHDPILSTKISFLHRTARDFLLENDEAKSFLACNGSSEAHVRLSIARGTLAQLAHFSQGDAKIVDKEWPHPICFPYRGVLNQISIAERLLGVAQAELMRSLDYESLARGYLVSYDWRETWGKTEAYMVEDAATLIDLVGMAAAVGMTFYVCEQLDLTIQSRCGSFSLPDLDKYSRNRTIVARLSWSTGNQLRDIVTGSATRLPSSDYRQALGECLQWKADAQPSSPTDSPSKRHLLAESYMLSCCQPPDFDLVRTLLAAGANPMVRVEPKPVGKYAPDPITEHTYPRIERPFWVSWLVYLRRLHMEHLKPIGRYMGSPFGYNNNNTHVTMNDIFDITKGLLARGADINFEMKYDGYMYLKRRYALGQELGVSMTASAMFILMECFKAEPEFREFAIAMEPLIKRPTRTIESVELPEDLYKIPKNNKVAYPCPSAEECAMLWPLIEKLDDTGSRDDLDALIEAVVEVWRAHNPGVKLRKRPSGWRNYYENSGDEGNDDDEGTDGDKDVEDDEKDDDDEKDNEEDDKKDEPPSA